METRWSGNDRNRMSVEEFKNHLRAVKGAKAAELPSAGKSGKKAKPPPNLEEEFLLQLEAARVPHPECQHPVIKQRKWRWDFAWPSVLLAVEIDGGGWAGRHLRPKGYVAACRKCNVGALRGWAVLHGTRDMIRSGELLAAVEYWIRVQSGIGDSLPEILWRAGLKKARAPRVKAKAKRKGKAVRS